MHEFSISKAIARTVLKSAKNNRAKKVSCVDLEIGELIFPNPSQVRFWLRELFKGTSASKAKIRIKPIKPRILCKKCEYIGSVKKMKEPLHHFHSPVLACPKCKSTETIILKGKECLIKNIIIEKADK